MLSFNKAFLFILVVLCTISCSFFKSSWSKLNVFPVSQDIELGNQVAAEIASNPADFPLLPVSGNENVYNYLNDIVKKILATNLVDYARDFKWEVKIINDPKTLNAFCTPGGHIYVYTGLMSFLDSEDQLAGVLGHEIAHAANRHSTQQLTKSLGVQILLDAALGKKEVIKQVTGTLAALSFSRANETQADSFSVLYLCPTNWNANGASGFFKKMQGQPTPPQWLSTHPSPTNRIKNIDEKKNEHQCKGKESNSSVYQNIKAHIAKITPPPPKTTSGANTNNAPALPKTNTPTPGKSDEKPAPAGTGPMAPKKVLKKG